MAKGWCTGLPHIQEDCDGVSPTDGVLVLLHIVRECFRIKWLNGWHTLVCRRRKRMVGQAHTCTSMMFATGDPSTGHPSLHIHIQHTYMIVNLSHGEKFISINTQQLGLALQTTCIATCSWKYFLYWQVFKKMIAGRKNIYIFHLLVVITTQE